MWLYIFLQFSDGLQHEVSESVLADSEEIGLAMFLEDMCLQGLGDDNEHIRAVHLQFWVDTLEVVVDLSKF